MILTLSANAKINLGLRIVGRRADPSGRTGGYHLIHTLFQEINFGDQITLTDQPSGEITLEVAGSAAENVPTDEDNLCLQAAWLFQERTETKQGVHIRLEKHIPMGSGLGGGSSNAAAVLRGLNRLWQAELSTEELERLAGRLGADVPFFIRGGLQLGEGIGEVLTPLQRTLPFAVALVIPPFSIDTAWAYGQFASWESFPSPPAFEALINQEPIPWEAFTNDFEGVVFPRYSQLAEIKAALVEQGAVYASLSGSGSGVYGLYAGATPEAELTQRFAECQVVVCRSVPSD